MISTSTSSLARNPARSAERRGARAARWIDLGACAPDLFHATYFGLARAQPRDAAPIVLWGRPGAHVCIGQCQDRSAEIVDDPGAPVVRRALGGGAVWIDEGQHCAVLITRAADAHQDRSRWITWALQPALATLRSFGLPAMACERDIWVRGRKIAGSGAATIGECAVFGFSFMLRFAHDRFANAVALPHEGLRVWLHDGLAASVTDWVSEAHPPSSARLVARFRGELHACLGWRMRDSSIRPAELKVIAALCADEDDDWVGGGSGQMRDSVKLNARSYLRGSVNGNLRHDTLILDGQVVRAAVYGCSDA